MRLLLQAPKKALKPLLKQKLLRAEIDVFKTNLITLLNKIAVNTITEHFIIYNFKVD